MCASRLTDAVPSLQRCSETDAPTHGLRQCPHRRRLDLLERCLLRVPLVAEKFHDDQPTLPNVLVDSIDDLPHHQTAGMPAEQWQFDFWSPNQT